MMYRKPLRSTSEIRSVIGGWPDLTLLILRRYPLKLGYAAGAAGGAGGGDALEERPGIEDGEAGQGINPVLEDVVG
jgi:hypothetical protein